MFITLKLKNGKQVEINTEQIAAVEEEGNYWLVQLTSGNRYRISNEEYKYLQPYVARNTRNVCL